MRTTAARLTLQSECWRLCRHHKHAKHAHTAQQHQRARRFCKVITKHKEATAASSDEADTLDAFVALGGNVSEHRCCRRHGFAQCASVRRHPADTRAASRWVCPAVRTTRAWGQADKSGTIRTDKLRDTIKEFELTLDIDRLIREVDYAG